MFSLTKSCTVALVAFVSLSLGSPLDRRMEAEGWSMLGYRTVNKIEATSINKVNELTYDKAFNMNQQLGIGKSLSGGAGQWDVGTNNWYCFVMMHTATLKSLGKIWIPEEHFFTSEVAVEAYIKSKGLDAAKTLRFAQVEEKTFNELFVPSTLVKSGESDIYAECYDSKAALTAGMKDMKVTMTTLDYTTATYAGPKPAA